MLVVYNYARFQGEEECSNYTALFYTLEKEAEKGYQVYIRTRTQNKLLGGKFILLTFQKQAYAE